MIAKKYVYVGVDHTFFDEKKVEPLDVILTEKSVFGSFICEDQAQENLSQRENDLLSLNTSLESQLAIIKKDAEEKAKLAKTRFAPQIEVAEKKLDIAKKAISVLSGKQEKKEPQEETKEVNEEPQEEIQTLRSKYIEKYGEEVPVNKKNNVSWIVSKL